MSMPILRRLTPPHDDNEEEEEQPIFIGVIKEYVEWWISLVTRSLRLLFLGPIICLYSWSRWSRRKVRRGIEWVRDGVKEIFSKLINLGITVGLIIAFPAMFLLVVPLYARRFVCRFQAT